MVVTCTQNMAIRIISVTVDGQCNSCCMEHPQMMHVDNARWPIWMQLGSPLL